MLEVDAGHKALITILNDNAERDLASANEATTRLAVIDRVLREVLGWQLGDMSVEERAGEDGKVAFADYILRTAATAIVVEAKRSGRTFVLPGRGQSSKLGGAISEGEVGDAVRQARDYCRAKSIPFGVATNGAEWVVFPALRTDGVTFEDSRGRVFRGWSDIRTRFGEFWNLLSRERVLEGSLEAELLGTEGETLLRRCLRDHILAPGYRLGRNAVYEHIEPAVLQAFSDDALLTDADALEECYVVTTERVKFDSRLRMYIQDQKPALDHATVRVRSRSGKRRLDDALLRGAEKERQSRFIVVLGPVGAGKTTFLQYTRWVSARALVEKKVLWLYVDFRMATGADRPRDFLYRDLRSAIDSDTQFELGDWEKCIRPAYEERIQALRRGVLQPLSKYKPEEFELKVAEIIAAEDAKGEPFVDQVLKHASRLHGGYIVIDNVDQIEGPDVQAAIFLESQAIARKTGLSVIICLREETYLKHRHNPAFDAFQFESFYVDPPSVKPVLSRRFGYAKRALKGHRIEFTSAKGMIVKVPDLSVFFDVVSGSLLDGNAGYMVEVLAGGNIRRGLALVREFLASGHTSADQALQTYLTSGRYTFPAHEFFKGAVLGQRMFFDDGASLVPNLFDAKLGRKGLSLARFATVVLLVNAASVRGFEGLPVEKIVGDLHRLGMPDAATLSMLNDLVNRAVLRTVDGAVLGCESLVVPTRFGGYLVREMAAQFVFGEFMAVDAVIYDEDTWDLLVKTSDRIGSEPLVFDRFRLRVARLRKYYEYVERLEAAWQVECRRRGLEDEWADGHFSRVIQPAMREDLRRVLQSARRNYGR